MRLPVLTYHHVGPAVAGTFPSLTVTPARFERHVRWLARRGYVGIRPSEWLAWRRARTPLPDKPVLLTFDDGYADLAEHALPTLRRYGFGAAVFIVTSQLGGENAWDQVSGSVPHRLLTAAQVRGWAGQGIEFGAHGRTHCDLTALSEDRLADEVRGSRDDLAAVTGLPVLSLAYPYGHTNDGVRAYAATIFDLAFGCEEGVNTERTDPFLQRRTMMRPYDSGLALACRVRWGRSPMDAWRARMRIRSRIAGAAARVQRSGR